MKLWASLYAMIWVVLIEFPFAMTPIALAMTPIASSVLIYLHILLGVAIVGLAFYNFSGVRKTRVAGRVTRIAQASFNLSLVVFILGLFIFIDAGRLLTIPLINVSVYGLILFLHTLIAFAIITQAAVVAIAYDMWEDNEFAEETEPGVVPPIPTGSR